VRRRTRLLKQSAVESLSLAVELCNRPYREARAQGVLLPLHHGLEMLLKAIIWQERRQIAPKGGRAYSFDLSVGIVQASGHIDEDDARALRMIAAHRDAVQHAGSSVSHEILAYDAMAGLFLADKLLREAFGRRLADATPFSARPLPLTSQPPREYHVLVSSEMAEIRALLGPKVRKRAEAITRLRPFAVADVVASGRQDVLDAGEVEALAKRLGKGEDWMSIFPGLARLAVDAQPDVTYGFKIVKRGDALPVRLVKEGDPEAVEAIVARDVDWFESYPFGLKELARQAGVSQYEAQAIAFAEGLRDEARCFGSKKVGKQVFKHFSHDGLRRVRKVARNRSRLAAARKAYSEHQAAERRAKKRRRP
jgi:hypothetical protein